MFKGSFKGEKFKYFSEILKKEIFEDKAQVFGNKTQISNHKIFNFTKKIQKKRAPKLKIQGNKLEDPY